MLAGIFGDLLYCLEFGELVVGVEVGRKAAAVIGVDHVFVILAGFAGALCDDDGIDLLVVVEVLKADAFYPATEIDAIELLGKFSHAAVAAIDRKLGFERRIVVLGVVHRDEAGAFERLELDGKRLLADDVSVAGVRFKTELAGGL